MCTLLKLNGEIVEHVAADIIGVLFGKFHGGEGGIRTPGWVSPTLAFEASSFNRSDTSPLSIVMATAQTGKQLPNFLFSNSLAVS